MIYSVIAAQDGDVYHDQVEAADQAEAEKLAREQLADAWRMTDTLQRYRDEGDEDGFDAELDGFAVDPVLPSKAAELRDAAKAYLDATPPPRSRKGTVAWDALRAAIANAEHEA